MITMKYKVIFYDCNMKLLRFSNDFDSFTEAQNYIMVETEKFIKYGGVFFFYYAEIKDLYVIK